MFTYNLYVIQNNFRLKLTLSHYSIDVEARDRSFIASYGISFVTSDTRRGFSSNMSVCPCHQHFFLFFKINLILILLISEEQAGKSWKPVNKSMRFRNRTHWLRLFSSQTFSRINTPTFLKSSHSSHPPAYEDGTECSETSAYKIQTPGNYPEESIRVLMLLNRLCRLSVGTHSAFTTPTCNWAHSFNK